MPSPKPRPRRSQPPIANAALREESVIDRPARMRFAPTSKRERILFTALELIGEEGFRGFSVNAVIRRGGFSKGSFFFHFASLDALCLACYELIRQFMLPRIDAGSCRNLRAFLEAFGEETLQATQTRHYFALVYFFAELAMTNPEFQRAQRELTEYYQESISREIRRLVGSAPEEGLVRDMVAYMSIVLDGVAGHRLMFDDPERMARVWPLVVDTVVRELERPCARRRQTRPRAEPPQSAALNASIK
jgi:AcrR family transcriptional regulator